jgi:hypothetical protein
LCIPSFNPFFLYYKISNGFYSDQNDFGSFNYSFLNSIEVREREKRQNQEREGIVGWLDSYFRNHSQQIETDKLTEIEKSDLPIRRIFGQLYKGIFPHRPLEKIEVGEITDLERMFLRINASDLNSKSRGFAIIELERHYDEVGKALIYDLLDGDLRIIPPLGNYYLIPLVKKYPDSRYAISCKEYGEIIGRPYFSYLSSSMELDKVRFELALSKPATQKISEWEDWLSRYPDHPGADDATFRLIMAHYENNDVMTATRLWMKLLTEKVGDGDVAYRAFGYLLPLLDVGLTIEQMEILLDEPQTQWLIAVFKYALAVKYARIQNYAKALELSKNLDREFEGFSQTLRDNSIYSWGMGATVKESSAWLSEQRQRWQKLLQLQQQNTSEAHYQIASSWAVTGGYKNGYLPFWGLGRFRGAYLPGNAECERLWVCNLRNRSALEIRTAHQLSNANAVAAILYQKLLDDPTTPDQVREKTLYMMASTLLIQFESSDGDNLRVHPLAGVKTSDDFWKRGYRPPSFDYPDRPKEMWNRNYSYSHEFYEKAMKADDEYAIKISKQIKLDYQNRLRELTSELKAKFPQSVYIDDLLFAQYFVGNQKDISLLKEIVEKYPNGDFAHEAKFLLDRSSN